MFFSKRSGFIYFSEARQLPFQDSMNQEKFSFRDY